MDPASRPEGAGTAASERSHWAWVLALGTAGLLGSLFLPWIYVGPTRASGGFGDLAWHTGTAYERFLFWAPPLASALLVAVSAYVLARGRRVSGRQARELFRTAWAVAGTAAFVLLLDATRWLGFYVARLLDSGTSSIHLGAVPYLTLLEGAALVPLARSGLRRTSTQIPARPDARRRALRAIAATAAAGLLLVPLVPFVVVPSRDGSQFFYDELTVATVHGTASGSDLPAGELAAARWILTAVLALSVAAQARSGDRPGWRILVPAVLGALAGAGLIVSTIAYVDLLQVRGQSGLPPNLLPPAAFLGLAALAAAELVRAARSGHGPSKDLEVGPDAPGNKATTSDKSALFSSRNR